jgi:hypothetical protein
VAIVGRAAGEDLSVAVLLAHTRETLGDAAVECVPVNVVVGLLVEMSVKRCWVSQSQS